MDELEQLKAKLLEGKKLREENEALKQELFEFKALASFGDEAPMEVAEEEISAEESLEVEPVV